MEAINRRLLLIQTPVLFLCTDVCYMLDDDFLSTNR